MNREVKSQEETNQLAALKSGSNTAFKFFYDRYSPQLYKKLLKMVHIQEIAEELLQDLFYKLWEKRESIDEEQSFQGYLYRISEHMVYDHYRKATRQARLAREVAQQSTELHSPIEDFIDGKDARRQIAEAISRLPDMQKRVFTLCKIEGKSYEEVSEQLGISKATINTHISRATKTLKAKLTDGNNTALLIAVMIAASLK
ncbi:RNA polymerase sigma factor [Pedobacter sp. PWIIR3]